MINNKKIGSTKEEVKVFLQNRGERNIVGGAGAFGLLGGGNLVSAGKQILKSGLGKGALNFVKNLLKKKQVPHGASKYASKRGQRRPDGTRI